MKAKKSVYIAKSLAVIAVTPCDGRYRCEIEVQTPKDRYTFVSTCWFDSKELAEKVAEELRG
jgi:hypothetical protein